jgi:hypothetical protein
LFLEGDREQDRNEDEEEDVSSYWVALRKREGTVNGKRKNQIADCGEVALELVIGMSLQTIE